MRLALFPPNLIAALVVAGVTPAWAELAYDQAAFMELGEGIGGFPTAVACVGDDHLFALMDQDGKPVLAHFYRSGGRVRRMILERALGDKVVALAKGPGRYLLVVEGDGHCYLAELKRMHPHWTLGRVRTVMQPDKLQLPGLGNATLNAVAAGPGGSIYLAYGRRILCCGVDGSGAVSHDWFAGPEPSGPEPAPAADLPPVNLEGPVSLAVDGSGRVYLLDREQGSITAYPTGGGEGTVGTPQWSLEGFTPWDLAACGDQLVVAGTASGQGSGMTLVAFTPAQDEGRIVLGGDTRLGVQLGAYASICLTDGGDLLGSDPAQSRVRLWPNTRVETKSQRASSIPGKDPGQAALVQPTQVRPTAEHKASQSLQGEASRPPRAPAQPSSAQGSSLQSGPRQKPARVETKQSAPGQGATRDGALPRISPSSPSSLSAASTGSLRSSLASARSETPLSQVSAPSTASTYALGASTGALQPHVLPQAVLQPVAVAPQQVPPPTTFNPFYNPAALAPQDLVPHYSAAGTGTYYAQPYRFPAAHAPGPSMLTVGNQTYYLVPAQQPAQGVLPGPMIQVGWPVMGGFLPGTGH